MASTLPRLVPRLLVAWTLDRTRGLLGAELAQVLDQALAPAADQGPLTRLQRWLQQDAFAQRLQQALQQVEVYVQTHCPDPVRPLARQLGFADLPAVQDALTDLPRAMSLDAVRAALREAIRRDVPHLPDEQVQQAVACYLDALQRALLGLEGFTLLVIGLAVLDLRAQQGREFAHIRAQLEAIRDKLEAGQPLEDAERSLLHQVIPTLPGDLPPGSYLPFPRNRHFTGREEHLAALAQTLLEEGRPAVVHQAITGMGGVGKTQLAIEFAYRYGYRFKGVHWLDLSDPALLNEAIVRAGQEMGLFPVGEQMPLPDQARMALRAWKADGPRLLILDNFEALERVNDVLSDFQHSSLRVLITSRRKDWHPGLGLRPLALDEFTPEESRAFLRQWLPAGRASDADLDALAQRLGHLPLALELAARYLYRLRTRRVADYLASQKTALEHPSMRGWKPEWETLTRHDLDLARTFALSWQQVQDPRARRLFVAAGYCAPNEPLPLDALRAVLADEGEDELAFHEALGELMALGLLKEGDPPAIHPLLAEFARAQDEGYAALRDLAQALAALAEHTNQEEDRTGNYRLFAPLLPHVRAVAARVEALGPDGPVPPDLAARLWNSLGYHLHHVADYAGAKAAFERALRIFEQRLGPEHPNVATAWNNLGLVLKALGDLEGAKAAFERALRIWQASLGDEHPHVATAWNNLGLVLKALGDLEGAKAAFERALRIVEQHLGPEHPHVATLWNNLGSVLRQMGDFAGAKDALERALRIDQAAFGPDHPNIARDLNNLGGVLQDLGDLQGAKDAYERALGIVEQHLGLEHPHVATLWNNLGEVLRQMGDFAGAKDALERALRIDQATFGPDHPNIARDLNNLGLVLRQMGDREGAKAAYERALRIFEQFLPPDHPHLRIVRENLRRAEEQEAREQGAGSREQGASSR